MFRLANSLDAPKNQKICPRGTGHILCDAGRPERGKSPGTVELIIRLTNYTPGLRSLAGGRCVLANDPNPRPNRCGLGGSPNHALHFSDLAFIPLTRIPHGVTPRICDPLRHRELFPCMAGHLQMPDEWNQCVVNLLGEIWTILNNVVQSSQSGEPGVAPLNPSLRKRLPGASESRTILILLRNVRTLGCNCPSPNGNGRRDHPPPPPASGRPQS